MGTNDVGCCEGETDGFTDVGDALGTTVNGAADGVESRLGLAHIS